MRRARPRGTGRIAGIKIRIVEGPTPAGAELSHALRILARMMVRSYAARGDHDAIADNTQSGSTLTVLPDPRPDHDANEAA